MSWGVGAWGTRAWGGGAPITSNPAQMATPSTVAGTGTVQAPLVAIVALAATVAGTGTVQSPTVTTDGPTPATVAGTGTVQSPVVVEAALPSAVAGIGTVQAASVSTPPVVMPSIYAWGTRAWGGGAPITSAVSTQTPTPAVIVGVGAVQSPTVALVALPATVAGAGTVQAPTGVEAALPATVAGTGTVQSPAVSTEFGPTPDVVSGTGTVQSPVVALVALPSVVSGTGSVQTPSISATTPPPPTPHGFDFQVWSMAAKEPVLVAHRTVLPSSGIGAAISDSYGVDIVSMGDRTGWYLAYDRGQGGISLKPTTLYAQLVHFDGIAITIGPEFAWDAVAHSLWRPSNTYQSFSHQIVGLTSTKAIRFWFQYDGSSLAIRAERIEFLSGTSEAPVVTDLGAITGEPACGTSAASFWAQRTREGAAAVYWTEVIAGSVVVHIDGFIDTPSQWARLQPDPIVNTGVSAGSAPFHYGSIIAGDESYFSGLQTSPYRAAVSLDFIISSPGAGVQEIVRRSKPSDYSLSQESLSGLADGSSVSPGSGSLEVDAASGDQVLRLHLWSRFVNTASTEIDVTELTPYLGTLVAGSVNQYLPKKQVAMSNAMFLGTWTDTDAHNQIDYINHARFPKPPRGALNVAGHRQSMHSKTSVRT